ncbi:hypothetical protein [Dickeya lacustris]|uniref:DUF3168 domain-containing protein n=1 Tax=Dickeya lacustris TaxID=2259638 RepID=A0ABY8G6Z6_9GAMM|nr:hypothetical protein [Dickeya lacustris]WFN55730.1 hypothetical protein O1Q98_19565 [Dickeya lacustris]
MTEEDIYPLLGKLANGHVYAYAVPCCDYHQHHECHSFILFSLSQENQYDASQTLTGQNINLAVDCYAHTLVAARKLREQVWQALMVLKPRKTEEYNDFDVEYDQFRMTLNINISR